MASLIERRKLMQGISSEIPYVRNGLTFWLDGIRKGENAGYWTDLIGGRLFQQLGNVQELGDRFLMTNGGYFKQSVSERFTLVGHTFEVCAQFLATPSTANWLLGTSSTGVPEPIFVLTNSGYFSYTSQTRTAVKLTEPLAPFTFSKIGDADMVGIYINKSNSITYGNNDSWGAQNVEWCIGARRPAFYNNLIGCVMSIRMYDRELTEAEVMHNQQVDNLRFNLGL